MTGLTPGTTSLTLTAGNTTTIVPVTVKSANLLAYGPGQQDGMTFTITETGALHVTGEVTGWRTVMWDIDLTGLAGQTVTFSYADFPRPFDSYVTIVTSDGKKTNKQGTFTLPDDLTQLIYNFRHATTSTDPETVDMTVHPMLNLGGTALDWMRPDTTDAPIISNLAADSPDDWPDIV